jgi:hypothetical protein
MDPSRQNLEVHPPALLTVRATARTRSFFSSTATVAVGYVESTDEAAGAACRRPFRPMVIYLVQSLAFSVGRHVLRCRPASCAVRARAPAPGPQFAPAAAGAGAAATCPPQAQPRTRGRRICRRTAPPARPPPARGAAGAPPPAGAAPAAGARRLRQRLAARRQPGAAAARGAVNGRVTFPCRSVERDRACRRVALGQ